MPSAPTAAASSALLRRRYASQPSSLAAIFAHVRPAELRARSRLPRALLELAAHNADLLLLQEVDSIPYEELLRPALGALGFDGRLALKSNGAKEGCALFWRTDSLRLAEEPRAVPLSQLVATHLLATDGTGEGAGSDLGAIGGLLRAHAPLREVLLARVGTVAQTAVFEPAGAAGGAEAGAGGGGGCGRRLVVVNTHLFFHPQADHVRLLQLRAALAEADALCEAHARAGPSGQVRAALLLGGDLNSSPDSGAAELLRAGAVGSSHAAWESLGAFRWGAKGRLQEPQEAQEAGTPEGAPALRAAGVGPVDVRAPPRLGRLVAATGVPAFTNHVPGFVETLDWVFASAADFETADGATDDSAGAARAAHAGGRPPSVAPMPSEADVRRGGSQGHLPGRLFPSDHVSVACDVNLRL